MIYIQLEKLTKTEVIRKDVPVTGEISSQMFWAVSVPEIRKPTDWNGYRFRKKKPNQLNRGHPCIILTFAICH